MAKTIEQKAKKYADNFAIDDASIIASIIHKVAEDSYLVGAAEQRKRDAEKACKWFRRENSHAGKEWLDHECDKLRKYMEE